LTPQLSHFLERFLMTSHEGGCHDCGIAHAECDPPHNN
jgi:hypothetical protein